MLRKPSREAQSVQLFEGMGFRRLFRPLLRSPLVLVPFVVAAACAADPGDDPKGDGSSAITDDGGSASGSSSGSLGSSGSGTGSSSGSGSSGSSTLPLSDAAASGSAGDDATADDTDVNVPPPPPSCPTCPITLDYQCPAPADATMDVKAVYEIINNGMMPQALSELTIRYWYDVDADSGGTSQAYMCDDARVDVVGGSNTPIPASDVIGTFGSAQTPVSGADSYMQIGFTTASGSIPPGLTAKIQNRFHKTGYAGGYIETGDYSYNPAATSFVPSMKITVYRMNVLIWGTEPNGTMPAGDP